MYHNRFNSVREVELPNWLSNQSLQVSRDHVESGRMKTLSIEELEEATEVTIILELSPS